MTACQNISKGLTMIFIGQILQLLSFIPAVGWVCGLVGLILFLVGLSGAGKYNPDYKKAFTLTIVNIFVSFIASILALASAWDTIAAYAGVNSGLGFTGILSVLFSIATLVISLMVVQIICRTTAATINMPIWTSKSDTVIKLYSAVFIINIVISFIGLFPFAYAITDVLSIITGIIAIVGGILFLMFVNGAKKVLETR